VLNTVMYTFFKKLRLANTQLLFLVARAVEGGEVFNDL